MPPESPDTVELWALGRLIPYARNARTHSDDQVAQIAASIVEFGWLNPVLIDDAANVIAGHGRLLAAHKLGLETIPVIRASHLTPAQVRAYRLADNRLAELSGWNEEMLAAELAALRQEDVVLGLLGFDETEIDRLLADSGEEAGAGDQAPEPPTDPVTRRGDLWFCGQHKVLCGDATVLADVESVLAGELADLCFTDPPYNVNYSNSADQKKRGKNRPILNDALGEQFGKLLYDACVNILAVTNVPVNICMSSSELDVLQKAFRAAGGHWSTFVIWAKNTFTLGRSDYQRQYEPILYGWKDGIDHYWCGVRDQGDVWFIDKPAKTDMHPTMKPVEL